MTQRSLDDGAEAPSSGSEPSPPPPEPAREDPGGPPPIPRPVPHLEGPSDTELRKRQQAWFAERARHEAYRRGARVDDGTG